MRLTAKSSIANDTGLPDFRSDDFQEKKKAGSCALSVVDAEGNWVQMMNTLQGGGIPGVASPHPRAGALQPDFLRYAAPRSHQCSPHVCVDG